MITKTVLKTLTSREIVALAVCPHCGSPVEKKSKRGPKPSYCSQECRRSQNNGDLTDGAAIIKFAKAWREARGQGPVGTASFAAMMNALDTMLDRDRRNGRPSSLYAAAVILKDGTNYADRVRS